jgi:two-component system response regulator AlgR
MKYLIVDDEPLAVLRLQKMLKQAGIEKTLSANNGKIAIEIVDKHHPNVIFLDIEMPVINGIEAAEKIKQISPESKIIFCTAYDNFAIKAFDLSASDYLLKPIKQERLTQALEKATNNQLAHYLTHKIGNDLINTNIDDVYCIISEQKNTYMMTQKGRFLIEESLINLESRFPQLLRINRNALINKSSLCGIHRVDNKAYAQLTHTDYQPEISRRNISKLKQQFT